MDDNRLLNLFIQKNKETKILNNSHNLSTPGIKSINELFISNENILKLSQILYRELYISNNIELFDKIKANVYKYTKLWVDSNKLSKFISDDYILNYNEQLRYINHLFINYYREFLLNGKSFIEHEMYDNNPYKHIYNYKINNKLNLTNDYNELVFNNYNDKYTTNLRFSNNYNKIPYYEKSLYSKNIDKNDNGSFRERKLLNNNFKKYNNNELFNGLDYLK